MQWEHAYWPSEAICIREDLSPTPPACLKRHLQANQRDKKGMKVQEGGLGAPTWCLR